MRGHVIHLKRIATACVVACATTWLVFGSTRRRGGRAR